MSFKEEVNFVINEIDNTVLNCSISIDPLSTLMLKKRKFENEDRSTPRQPRDGTECLIFI